MRGWGWALVGVAVGVCLGFAASWSLHSVPSQGAATVVAPPAAQVELARNLRIALLELNDWRTDDPRLGAEPVGAIPAARLESGDQLVVEARITTISAAPPSVTFDVLTESKVPGGDLGYDYKNLHVYAQRLPLSSVHIPVFVFEDPEDPRPGMVASATGAPETPTEGVAGITLGEFLGVLRYDSDHYFTRDAVFDVHVNSEGQVYMLSEVPVGS